MTDHINHPWLKAVSALTGAALMDWLSTAGKVCAAIYAVVVLGEWVWKRIAKRRRQ